MTTVYIFRWIEGQNKRRLEAFNFVDGMTKVLSLVLQANKEGLPVSGMSSFSTVYNESMNNINLRLI